MNTALLLLGMMRTVPIVFLGMLLFVVLFLTVVITVLARRDKSGLGLGLTLMGVFISLLGLAFSGIFFLRSSPTVEYSKSMETGRAYGPAPPVPPSPPVEGPFDVNSSEIPSPTPVVNRAVDSSSPSRPWDPWDDVVEETFRADVYCSVASAERALVRECLNELGPHLAETPETVYVVVNPVVASQKPWLGANVDDVIRDSLPLTKVQHPIGNPNSPNPENGIVLVFDLPEFQLADNNGLGTQSSGSVSLKGTYGDHVFEGTKRFTEKLWVNRFGEFVNQHPRRTLMRANCRSFATDEVTAYEDAVDVAVEILLPRAMALLAAQPGGHTTGAGAQAAVRQQLRAGIEHDSLIADQFVQQLDGSSGTVWRAALLLDYQPGQLAQLANLGRAVSETEQQNRIVTGLAVALMFGLVVALYLVVNELTKGYFVWNLRAAAMLALLSIVVAVCWWIR